MRVLVDTDVLIDFLRGVDEAVDFIKSHADDLNLSAITVAELYQGVREGKERRQLDRFISATHVLPVSPEIAANAGLLRRDHRAKLGCGLADCLIAATADQHHLTLATLNQRHFAMLDEVHVPYTK